MFNGNVRTNKDFGRELGALQTTMVTRFSQMDQSNAAHRLHVANEITKATESLERVFFKRMDHMEMRICDLLEQRS